MKSFLYSIPGVSVYTAIFCFLMTGPAMAQHYFNAEETHAIKLGRTKPLHQYMVMEPTDREKLKTLKLNKPKVIPNFGGRRHLEKRAEHALPVGADPLYNPSASRGFLNEILPTISFDGLNESNSFVRPPDVNGEMGKDFYVEIVNASRFRVYDRTGNPLSNPISTNAIWSQVAQSSGGDPILLYDQTVDRWILTEINFNNRMLIAVSLTGDPRGSWDAYAFQAPSLPDYPKYGIWHDAYYLATNEDGFNYPIYAFNRADLLAGATDVRMQRLTAPKNFGVFFEIGQPVDWDGSTPPPPGSPGLMVKLNDDDWNTTLQDHIVLHKIRIDWGNAANSNLELIEIPTAPFDSEACSLTSEFDFSCIPQPNQQGIDGIPWVIMNKAQYRNFGTHESIVFCFMVDVTGDAHAGIRWIELRKTSQQDWHLYQEGTIGENDGIHRFMGSIAIDASGNIGIGYSVSGYDKHPSLRYTGRYASDPLGTMTFEEFEFATGGGSINIARFGDYASMTVDPADEHAFWFAGEYVLADGDWSTRIVSFLARRDTFDIFPITLISPKTGAQLGNNEHVSVCVLNRGLNTVHDFSVAYQFEGGNWIVEPASVDSLAIDSQYCHTFQQPVSFPSPGDYQIRFATILDVDGNRNNDSLSFLIQRIPFKDVAVVYDVPTAQTIVCGNGVDDIIQIRNLGVDTIHTLTLKVTVNGSQVDTIIWSGELVYGEEETFNVKSGGLNDGENTIDVIVIELNGGTDEFPQNNGASWTVMANPDGYESKLNLLTDNFPLETTWELTDVNGQVVSSGGPYTEQQTIFISEFCLDPNACYKFSIYDSFGDGMAAQGVRGDFDIVSHSGDTLAQLSLANFGDSVSVVFCLSNQCLLELLIGVENESMPGAGDAIVTGFATNGAGDIMYSIDGINFQLENTFFGVPPGDYLMTIVDEDGCEDSLAFTVYTCQLQTVVTTLPASGGDVGEIHIDATGGNGPLTYSLNGGNFISDNFFTMLEPGDYVVTTRDSVGCEKIDSVTVSTNVSTKYLDENHFIRISPNPGKGLFQVNAQFDSEKTMVAYTVYSMDSQPVVRSVLGKYNENYKGEFSLIAYPAGMYYVVFHVENRIAVRRIMKSE